MATGTYSENGPPSMENATFAAEGGTFFARSRGFTINSSVLNNFAGYAATPGVPPDVRTITMGDIDLQRQLRPDELRFDDNASVVGHERRRGCVRRVYSAKLEGHNSDMTVAVYDGDTAKQEWHRDIAKHTRMRHPNILQIYGIASANGVHAALFHGDLIPYKHFLNLYKHSPVLTVYIVASTAAQFWEAAEYWGSRFSKCYLLTQYTLWIRPSTGLLSADFTPTKHDAEEHMSDVTIRNPLLSFSTLNLEPMVIDCMRLQEYHQACGSLCHYERNWIPSSAPVTIGAVVSWPLRHQYEDSLQIACLDLELDLQLDPFPRSLVTENGWNQYSISALLSNYRTPKFRFQAYAGACNIWLSQANHILNSLHINNSLQDYSKSLLEYVEFTMDIQRATEEPSTGYLFVCPASHFRIGPVSFKWPDCPAYWSFDSSGSERLSPDEATRLGFPSLKLATRVGPYSWDTSVYAGLRQFHTGKGFDPDSQDVARHLDYPLFQISNHAEDRFAHVNCEHGSAAEDAEDIRATSEAPPSRAFGFLINLQLALISFLALCRVYERMY